MQVRTLFRLIFLLAVLGAAISGSFAQQSAPTPTTGKLVEIKVPAPALKRITPR